MNKEHQATADTVPYLSLEERTCLSVVVSGSQGNVETFKHFTLGCTVLGTASVQVSENKDDRLTMLKVRLHL